VTLDGLKVPEGLSVESGGEIEAFVRKHSATQPSGEAP
jgi:hypothetical protein